MTESTRSYSAQDKDKDQVVLKSDVRDLIASKLETTVMSKYLTQRDCDIARATLIEVLTLLEDL